MNHSHGRSKALQKFVKTQNRSMSLAQLYSDLHDKNMAGNRDLVRSAIVLSVASMDAYFTDKFSDLIVPAMKITGVGDSLKKLLESAGLDLQECVSLLTMQRPYNRIRALVTSYLESRTTQSIEAIDELYLCFGIKDFCACIEGTLGRKNLLKRVQRLVERRHRIVHDGDYSKHQKLSPIEFEKTIGYMNDLITFVAGAEKFLNEKLKK